MKIYTHIFFTDFMIMIYIYIYITCSALTLCSRPYRNICCNKAIACGGASWIIWVRSAGGMSWKLIGKSRSEKPGQFCSFGAPRMSMMRLIWCVKVYVHVYVYVYVCASSVEDRVHRQRTCSMQIYINNISPAVCV
jgi:hypothetical protein